ncbi:CAP domain-containing protein [Nannocystis radixulma]|uniref:CAP domain-containing protein n=1 Tax=Nannocystis radixulma TaxID=2995305 RepID=A0ABT5AWX4_9BACT|nr:CAP domain-containing protein [Nannocystis radixulma]MDC0666326.1 CAP domain-containing protein [Nannocystis radixulma]
MHNAPRILALLALLAPIACDVDDETATRVGEGIIGIGLDSTELAELGIDALTDSVDPSFACNDNGWKSAWAKLEDQVITLVNQRRAAGAVCGGVSKPPVPPVTAQAQLRCAARGHSKDMGVNNFASHVGSDGSTFTERITAAGYAWTTAGENIAGGYSTAAQVVNAWMASTGHCNNIMNGNFTDLGVGYYYSKSAPFKYYWTQDFGRN